MAYCRELANLGLDGFIQKSPGRAAALNRLAHRLAVDQLHRQIKPAVVLAAFEKTDDVTPESYQTVLDEAMSQEIIRSEIHFIELLRVALALVGETLLA